jgi:WD40 repeat protein
MARTKILFLAANPDTTTPLHAGREVRRIRERLASAAYGGSIEIVERWAVRPGDLQPALLEVRPQIVHFSGHGNDERELMLEGDSGSPQPVGKRVLGELFRLRGDGVRLVVLSACHSLPQAEAIAEHVDCAIGMRLSIGSEAATELSAALYHAIASGDSIQRAFESARLHVEALGIPEHRTPQLVVRRTGVDPARIVFTGPVQPTDVVLSSGAPIAGSVSQPERSRFHVPFLQNKGFVGREDDLERLHALLQKGEAVGVRPAALTGMGGIGKTQLAVEYAYRYRQAYPDGIYWVNAADDWQAELARLAVDVGCDAGDAPEGERRLRLALAFAAFLKERPGALLIFDNVEEPLELRTPKAGFIPEQLGCRLLFTTRRRELGSSFASIDVRVLPEETALRLLLSSEPRQRLLEAGAEAAMGAKTEMDAAKAICRTLGYLPLALVLAAAYLGRYPSITLSGYLKRILREGALAAVDAANVDPRTLATRHNAAVKATLRTQWEALAGDNDAEQVMKTAALLAEAAEVPRARLSLLTGLAVQPEAEGYPAPLAEALGKLEGLSLVEELTDEAIRLHPLVREFAAGTIEGRDAFGRQCAHRLTVALWDMGRLSTEVAGRTVGAVLADLRVAEELAGAPGAARLQRFIRPLDREAHCLRRWDSAKEPAFFLQQLRNRCFEMDLGDVMALAEAKLKERKLPWLRERIRTSRESEALVRTLEGHSIMVNGVAVTADGRFAVSASSDSTLKVWDLATGQAVRTLEGHHDWVKGVAVTPDGRFAVSASGDNTLKVWDLATGQAARTLEGHSNRVKGVAVTPDGRFAVSASSDNTLKVWDMGTGHAVRTLEGHSNIVNGVAVTADGRFAVSASSDNTLKVWDLATGQAVRTLEDHSDGVNGVAVTVDGRFAISASSDNTLKVWDLASGQAVDTLEGHSYGVNGVAVTLDGRFAVSASSDRTLKVWDMASGQTVRTLEGHSYGVNGVAVTADGRFAVSTSADARLKVWDLASGHSVHALEGHRHGVKGVAVTPDGRFALSASADNTLKVWDLATGQAVRTLAGHSYGVKGVAVTPDGQFAVSASSDNTLIVWHLATGQAVRTLQGHSYWVNDVAVTPDGRCAVSVSDDGTLKVWDLATGQAVRTIEIYSGSVNGVAVTPDGRFAVYASNNKTLKVWDLATGQAVRKLEGHSYGVNGVAATADGRFAVSASNDSTLKVWDLATGQAVRTLQGHSRWVNGVAVTADGRFAVSVSHDNTLKVWDLATGQAVSTLEAHAPLLCCAFTSNGTMIIAGDTAGGVHFIDWLHAEPILRAQR